MFEEFPKYYRLFTELEDLVKQKFPQDYEIFRFNNMDLSFRLRDLELICLRYEDEKKKWKKYGLRMNSYCLLYTSPSPRDRQRSRMPSSA